MSALSTDLQDAFSAQDAERVAGLYTDDAVFLLPGRPPAVGRDQVKEVVRGDFADPAFSLQMDVVAEAGSGSLRYVLGNSEVRFTDPASSIVRTAPGFFLQILRERTDGTWQIAVDISCPGGPPLSIEPLQGGS